MKKFFGRTILVFTILPALGWAETSDFQDDVSTYKDIYHAQISYLASRPQSHVCPAEKTSFAHRPEINMSIFYGYTNADDSAEDLAIQRALALTLMAPCRDRIWACGFKTTEETPTHFTLERKISYPVYGTKKIRIAIYASALTMDDRPNWDVQGHLFEQEAKSQEVSKDFFASLGRSDVVYYSGHSRYGGGPSFSPLQPTEIFLQLLWRPHLRQLLQSIRERPPQLKIFGMFSCDSKKYYSEALKQANPQLPLIISTDAISISESEQAMFASINSILRLDCAADLEKSMRTHTAPEHSVLHLVNFK